MRDLRRVDRLGCTTQTQLGLQLLNTLTWWHVLHVLGRLLSHKLVDPIEERLEVKRRSHIEDGKAELPEERRFQGVLKGVLVVVVLFTLSFLALTGIKSLRSPQDITSNWFVAWGTWAGGLCTAAAFLIAAFSILVASAHSRFDRHQEAMIREDNDMSQARLLSIYKVEDQNSLSTLPEYRIENRSKDWFFDVTVPYVYSPNGVAGIECRTATLAEKDFRLGEHIPTGLQLTPYRDNSDEEPWFTLVRVHTTNARVIEFDVEYTDSSGRRWRQSLDGQIERIPTTKAVLIRPPDKFHPRPLIRKLSPVEVWSSEVTQSGVTEGLPTLNADTDFLAVIGEFGVENWRQIERLEHIDVQPGGDPSGAGRVVVTISEPAPVFWLVHFRDSLAESGLSFVFTRVHPHRTDGTFVRIEGFRYSSQGDSVVLTNLIDSAIQYANGRFEEKEFAAARRALKSQIDRRDTDS